MARSEEVIVVGHRNPDNDAICAAVGYAYLMNMTDSTATKYTAYRQGPLPDETAWVLDRFEVAPPRYIPHVHSRVADAMTRDVISISHDNIMLEAGRMMRANGRRFLPLVALDGRFVVCRSLALDERDGILRAARQAIAEPVAEIVAHELRLAVDNRDRPLMAGIGADTASGALVLIDFDNGSQHVYSPLSSCCLWIAPLILGDCMNLICCNDNILGSDSSRGKCLLLKELGS